MLKINAALVSGLLVVLPQFAMPASAASRANVGTAVEVSGSIEVSIEDDFAVGRATKHYALLDSKLGRRYELRTRGTERSDLTTGMKVHVKGALSGDVLTVDDSTDAVTVFEVAATTATSVRRAAVLLVDIIDGAGVKHAISSVCDGSTAQSAGIMFGQGGMAAHVDGCYRDSSFGAMGWGGAASPGSSLDVVRVTVNDATLTLGSVCNSSAWATAADTMATGLGLNLANYEHRVYVLPTDVGCGWAGRAVISCGSTCKAWLKAYASQPCGYPDAYAHELGHNVGLLHSSTDTNNDGTIDCEYCDDSDFMGYAEALWRTQNGPHKVQTGWLAGSGIVDGGAGGLFTIAALEQSTPSFPQAVKIVPSSGRPYYLSYRAPMGYDASMPQPTTYANRTSVHRWDTGNTLFVASVGDGQSFVDSVNGITITQERHDAGTATLRISTSPTRRKPTMGITPAAQTVNALPALRSYTVTVTNADDAGIPSSVFGLTVLLPTGWFGSISPTSLVLAPGASGTATLTVTAPAGTADGSYAVQPSTVADADHASASASVAWTIDATKPTAPSGLTATVSGNKKVALRWGASSDSGSGVAFYRVYVNGTPLPSNFVTTTYTDMPRAGTWTYTVRAQDRAGNLSDASNSVTVTLRGNGR